MGVVSSADASGKLDVRCKSVHSGSLLQKILRQGRLRCVRPRKLTAPRCGLDEDGPLTRGDVVAAREHVERQRPRLRRDRPAIPLRQRRRVVEPARRAHPGSARPGREQEARQGSTDRGRRISVTLSWNRPCCLIATSGNMKYTPRRPWRLRSRCGDDTRLPYSSLSRAPRPAPSPPAAA